MKKNDLADNFKVEEIRINKFISEKGVCSRREADRLISLGKVTINGEVATMGSKVTYADEVKLDGKLLSEKPKSVYIALNKPKGIVSTTDPKEKNNIVNFINYPERIFHIGRLDKDSEGLIFLTNDGDIVNKILRAGNNHEKEYIVTVDKPLTQDFLQRMCSGVRILGTITKPCKIYKEGSNIFRIILTQGLNRQIRRMCEALGYTVTKLKRIRIMNVRLDNLPLGKWRYLSRDEIQTINELVKNSLKTEEASK
ncbi:23S rRNA pseudouridine2604 synthase [Clostridium pascui]|uniref:23S rRNA pseudouridine(2604) synthase RluF n=1 Tax=Clostridium pascui TaxID=46609 RepID=UPI00195EFB02|nr:23S rRNA pseudouridine(2604) synthase RluF [Clostridium pascui]MBM7870643.1 23S rRNA pseudouridine2604 synthase [Clostridium pascui]